MTDSINRVFVTGRLTSDAVEKPSGSGFCCFFHMNIGTGNGAGIWLCVHYQGKRAEDIFDDLEAGTLVAIEGAFGAREKEQAGPVHIKATRVVCHLPYSELDAL